MFHDFPYTNFHEINLDWIINKLKEKYGPDNPPENMVLSVNGMTGDVVLYEGAIIRFPDTDDSSWNMHRLANGVSSGIEFTPDGATRISGTDRIQIYDAENPPEYPVLSVNGQTGAVVLYQSNIVRLPDTGETTWNFYRLVDEKQAGIQFSKTGPAQRIDGTNRYNMYDEGNPPPYPVTSVNGLTGAVVINVPVQSVNGQTGDVVIQIPVTSVNGKTGAVNTPFDNINSDVLTLETESSDESWGMERPTPDGSLGFTIEYNNGHTEAYIYYDGPGSTTETLKLLTQADIPSSAGVVSINGQTGSVTLYGNDIYTASGSGQTVTGAIQAEASRANTAEQGLAGNIQSEATRAGAEEAKLQDSIAIIVDGDTAGQAVPVGGYAYIKNNTHGLTDGLYTNTGSAVFPTTGGTADSTTFTAVSGGGLNALNNNLASKTGTRSVGLVTKNTQINLTDEEKSAKLLIAHFARYGYVQTAIFSANINYIAGSPFIPSVGTFNDPIKIVATGTPVESISFTGTDIDTIVTIIRIM